MSHPSLEVTLTMVRSRKCAKVHSGVFQIPFGLHSALYLSLILGVPGAAVAALFLGASSSVETLLAALAAGPIAIVSYGLVAGALGWIHSGSVVAGRVKRDLSNRAYRGRRLHGLAWTAIYYCKPVYHVFLCVPILKRVLFRMFGYRGSLKFTTYPDTWIRDLPLLDLGRGAYVSNRATLGTNIVFPNGRLLVDRITLEDEALVGHLCMLAPGCFLGRGAEIGVGTALGIRARVGAGARVGPQCTLEHGVHIGERTMVGIHSFIGSGSRLGPGLSVPPGSTIPARCILESQADLDQLLDGSRCGHLSA